MPAAYNTRRTAMVIAVLVLSGCGDRQAAAPAPPSPQSTASTAPGSTTLARIHVIDLNGNPLANMVPIASAQPNAFDGPVAQGGMTGPDGMSTLVIPSDKWLYLRAWDPARRIFANNFFEALPGEAPRTGVLDVVMAPGCALEAELRGPDGAPVANENVGIMMFHPARGAWWPDEADTDAKGRVRFPCVPPGRFVIKLKTARGLQIDVSETPLPPSGLTDLGVVVLQ
jgi:hypothetical protein